MPSSAWPYFCFKYALEKHVWFMSMCPVMLGCCVHYIIKAHKRILLCLNLVLHILDLYQHKTTLVIWFYRLTNCCTNFWIKCIICKSQKKTKREKRGKKGESETLFKSELTHKHASANVLFVVWEFENTEFTNIQWFLAKARSGCFNTKQLFCCWSIRWHL